MTKMENAAHSVINKCLNVQKGESVLIISNSYLDEIAKYLFDAAKKRTKFCYALHIGEIDRKAGIDNTLSKLMCSMDVIIAATCPSISHTDARRKACRRGARFISMPNILPETFSRLALADYVKIGRRSHKLKDILSIANEAKVTAPNGTDMHIYFGKKQGYADIGILDKPGLFSNLPAGEASIAPDEGKSEGILVVDSGMGVNFKEKERLALTFKDGKAYRISGDSAAERLRQQLAPFGPNSRLIAEFGIGTNDAGVISGCSLEDEKVLGTIHVAIGNNVSFGGNNNVPIHLDGVVHNATVKIDGRLILDRGKLIL